MPTMSSTIVIAVVFIFATTVSNSKSPPDFPCKSPHHNHYPFCDTSLSVAARARSLVSLLTLPEKVSQLCNNASAVPRLGVPAYEWWSEALHGLATNGPGVSFAGAVPAATAFPQVLLQAASFSRPLWRRAAAAVAAEARAMYNSGQAGLTFWAPNVNLFRDPRWGRGQETPGEDPFVASEFAVEFVTAFQGGNKKKKNDGGVLEGGGGDGLVDVGGGGGLMLSACCKHFSAYDLEMWRDFARYNFNAVVTDQDFEDTYQAPFRSCVEKGKASCLMCSYNAVNGVPACARKELLDQARNEWGFKGYITSDCDAVATVYEYQHYTKTPEDAVADVLKAGTDINCGTYLLRNTLSAVQQGKVEEEDIDRALVNLFSVQIRLGLFDGDPRKGKYGKLGPQDVCSSEHKELALEAARQGIVLLKNDNKFLPLRRDAVSSLALIGPWTNDYTKLGGGYSGIPCTTKSLFDALKEHVKITSYALGCHNVSCDSDAGFHEAVGIAKEADYVIMILGIDLSQEREDLDRVSLLLPGKQMDLVSSVAAASKKPVILVLTGGGPLDVSFAEAHPHVASILWIGYPGEAGGQALAEIVFGDVNPSGRLAMTWYPEAYTNIPMNDMRMRSDPSRGYPGRTYRFYTGSSVYEFGHGLSYVNYTYRPILLPKKLSLSGSFNHGTGRRVLRHVAEERRDYVYVDEVPSCDSLRFPMEFSVENLGDSDGRHVVMIFSKPPKVVEGAPEKQLAEFESVFVVSGGSTKVSVSINACSQLSFSDERGKRVIPLGVHVLLLGDLEYSISVEI